MDINCLKHCLSPDLETSGINPEIHGMISLGVTLFNKSDELYIENQLRDDAVIDPEALNVNGETVQGLRERTNQPHKYVTEQQALMELIVWAKAREATVIVGKNPQFDYNFLKCIWLRAGGEEREFESVFSYRLIDWSAMVLPLMMHDGYTVPKNGAGSADIERFLGIPSESMPHIAINGARHNRRIVRRIFEMYSENT